MNTSPQDRFMSCCLCDRDGGRKPFESGLIAGIESDDFVGPARVLFDVLLRLYSDHIVFSSGIVEAALKTDHPEMLNEKGYIHSLYALQSLSQEAYYWADKIRGASQVTKFKTAAAWISELAEECTDEESGDIIARAQQKLFAITQSTAASNKDVHAVGKSVIEKWRTGEVSKIGIPWPIQKLQQVIGYITDELVIIAALPSVGKTAISLQMAIAATKNQRMVSFLSLESSAEKIAQRLIAHYTQIPTLPLRGGQSVRYDEALERWRGIKELPFRLRTGPHTAEQVHAWAQAEKAAGSKLLILDNLKHVRVTRKFNSRPEQFGWLSQEMKNIRDEVQLPFIVIHHMTDDDKLSWSADIHRDFDIIVIMAGTETVDFEVRKNRDGQAGFEAQARFEKDVQTFTEIAT